MTDIIPQWCSIADAPKNGSEILVRIPGVASLHKMYWDEAWQWMSEPMPPVDEQLIKDAVFISINELRMWADDFPVQSASDA